MKNKQWITIFTVLMSAFVTTFTGSALNLAVPDIGEEFGAAAAPAGWIITIYTIAVAAVAVPAGRVADKSSRKKVLIAGLLVFCVSCFAAMLSGSLWFLIAMRALQGAGAAMIFSTNTAILVEEAPAEQRGRMLGYSMAATYTGMSAGPVIGGLLNYSPGWRAIFALTGGMAALGLGAALKCPDKTTGNRAGNKFQIKNKKIYLAANCAALLNYGAVFAVSYIMASYLQVAMGYDSRTAGFILLAQPVVISLLSPLAGKLSDRKSPVIIAALGMAICGIGCIPGAFARTDGSLLIPVSVLLVTGAGTALFSSPNTNAVMSCVEEKNYSGATAVLAAVRAAGNTLGMMMVSAVSYIYIGDDRLKAAAPEQVADGASLMFIILAVFLFVGIFPALAGRKRRS